MGRVAPWATLQPMRVLVTGASGFLGRVACARLVEEGHEVVALVRRPGSEPEGTRAVAGDLSEPVTLVGAVADAAPDAVLHLAAEIASQRNAAQGLDGQRRGHAGAAQRLPHARPRRRASSSPRPS